MMIDYLGIHAGDELEVGVIIAWREWRYRWKPFKLLSLSYDLEWLPDHFMESDPDVHHSGIFAFKKRPERWGWSRIESAGPQDGYVIGKVALWGVVWEHQLGYRAQYAKPLSFEQASGKEFDKALDLLRRCYG